MVDLTKWLSVVRDESLRSCLREREEDALAPIDGDIYALQIGYRLICRFVVKHRRMPGLIEMPARLTQDLAASSSRRRPKLGQRRLGGPHFGLLCERVEHEIRHIAGYSITLKPPARNVFGGDYDGWILERERRAKLYEKQWARIEQEWGTEGDPSRMGPGATPVVNLENGEVFESARQAAAWIVEQRGQKVSRADIRTAIKRKTRCAGIRWGYLENAAAKIVRSGREMRLRCVEADRVFDSQAQAASWLGISHSTLAAAMEQGGLIRIKGGGTYTFERLESESPAPRATIAVAQLTLF